MLYQHNSRQLFFALLLIANFLGPFGGNMILPMFEALKHDFAVDVFLLGLSITFFMVPFAVTQLFSGLLSELFYGKRKVIVSGFIITCFGFLLAVFSFNIWVFLVSRVIQGVGFALATPLIMAMVGDVFERSFRGRVIGSMAVAITLGVTLGPLVGGFLASINWRIGFAILSILSVFTTLFALAVVPQTRRVSKDEELGLKILWRVFTRKVILAISLVGLILFSARISIYTYLSDLLTLAPYNLSSDLIGGLLALAGIGGLFAGPISGYLTDKIGRRRTAIAGLIMVLVVLCLYLIPQWYTLLAFILFLMGFSTTTASTAVSTMAVEVDPKHRDIAVSIYNSMRSTGYALGPIVAYPLYATTLLEGVVVLAVIIVFVGLVLTLKFLSEEYYAKKRI